MNVEFMPYRHPRRRTYSLHTYSLIQFGEDDVLAFPDHHWIDYNIMKTV